MVEMERIHDPATREVKYRGTLVIGAVGNQQAFVAEGILTEQQVCSEHRAEDTCIHRIIDRLLEDARSSILLALHQNYTMLGTYDNTHERPRSPEHPRCRSTVAPIPMPPHAGPGIDFLSHMDIVRREVAERFGNPTFKPFRPSRNTPERRAMALLYRKIGRIRVRYMKKFGYFEEQGQHGLYRFHKDKQGGVTFIQEIEVGGLKKRPVQWDLCVQSQAPDLPPGDVILSRWLAWKADEDQFLATANFRNISTVDEATAGGPEVRINVNALSWDLVAESMIPVLRQMGHRG